MHQAAAFQVRTQFTTSADRIKVFGACKVQVYKCSGKATRRPVHVLCVLAWTLRMQQVVIEAGNSSLLVPLVLIVPAPHDTRMYLGGNH